MRMRTRRRGTGLLVSATLFLTVAACVEGNGRSAETAPSPSPLLRPDAPETVRFPVAAPAGKRTRARTPEKTDLPPSFPRPDAPEVVRLPLPTLPAGGPPCPKRSETEKEAYVPPLPSAAAPEVVRFGLNRAVLAFLRRGDAAALQRTRATKGKEADARIKRLTELARKYPDLKGVLQELQRTKNRAGGTAAPVALPIAGLSGRPRPAELLRALRLRLGTVKGKVVDARTGKQLPALVRVRDLSGPREARVPGKGFWCTGKFSVRVLSGPVEVEISAGRFRTRYLKRLYLRPGEKKNLGKIRLARLPGANFEARGRFPTTLNLRVRARPNEARKWTGEAPLPEDLVLAARAAGVSVLGLEAPVKEEMRGLREAQIVAYCARLGEKADPVVVPVFHGPRNPHLGAGWAVNPARWADLRAEQRGRRLPLRDTFDELRRRGAAVVFGSLRGERGGRAAGAGAAFDPERRGGERLYPPAELPFDLVTGSGKVILAFAGSPQAEAAWFTMLNEGFRATVVADEAGSLEGGRAPAGNTFLLIEGKPTPTPAAVAAACRAGAATVSFGPALFARLVERNRIPGETVPADGRALTFSVQLLADSRPGTWLDRLEIIRNGKVIHTERFEFGQGRVDDLRFKVRERRSAWYVLRAVQLRERRRGRERKVEEAGRAWTNPFFFVNPRDGGGRRTPGRGCRVRGTLLNAASRPTAGTASLLEPGRPTRRLGIAADGRYAFTLSAAGAVVFSAPGYAPTVWRLWTSARVREKLAALERQGARDLLRRLGRPAIYRGLRGLTDAAVPHLRLQPLKPPPAGGPAAVRSVK